MSVYVKTVYNDGFRLPNIAAYKTEKAAEGMINIALKWGISIQTCRIISKEEGKALLKEGGAESDIKI